MISMLVIVGLFAVGLAALCVLGRHVAHPDDEAELARRIAGLRADWAATAAEIGAALVPAFRELGVSAARAAEAFRSLGEALARAEAWEWGRIVEHYDDAE